LIGQGSPSKLKIMGLSSVKRLSKSAFERPVSTAEGKEA